jgi:hypothetical protein
LKLAVDEIRGPPETLVAEGGAYPHPTPPTALHAQVLHQAFHGATGDVDAVLVELVPYLVGAVDREILLPHPRTSGLSSASRNARTDGSRRIAPW